MLYRLVNWSLRFLLLCLCRIRGGELKKVPLEGPFIIVTNHINFLEVPLLYLFMLPRRVIGLVKAETWHNPLLQGLAELWEAIPLHRNKVDGKAFRRAVKMLKGGRIVIIAPEGTRSKNGRLQRGYPGVVLLALKSGSPLLPVVHYGGENFWSNLRALRRTDFIFRVGRPFRLEPEGRRVNQRMRRKMTDEIMFQLAALLPKSHRGVYADLASASRRYLRFRDEAREDPQGEGVKPQRFSIVERKLLTARSTRMQSSG